MGCIEYNHQQISGCTPIIRTFKKPPVFLLGTRLMPNKSVGLSVTFPVTRKFQQYLFKIETTIPTGRRMMSVTITRM
jgi:hypothetical protein